MPARRCFLGTTATSTMTGRGSGLPGRGSIQGDRLFFSWLRSYIKNFTYKVAETRHLITILEQVTGEKWQDFFERHVYGNESPPV